MNIAQRINRLAKHVLYRQNRAISKFITHNTFSIRRFLVVSLLSILTVAVLAVAGFNYWQITRQSQHLLQMELINASQILQSFMALHINDHETDRLTSLLKNASTATLDQLMQHPISPSARYYLRHKKQLAFQVWNADTKRIIMRSENAPKSKSLSSLHLGFDTQKFSNTLTWNTFTVKDIKTHTLIMVGFRQSLHHNLDMDLFMHVIIILGLIYVYMGILLLLIVEIGLRPLTRITKALEHRSVDNLSAISARRIPIELIPMVESINRLLSRLDESITRERRFSADAAHELRTPIAALKAKTEVALREPDLPKKALLLHSLIQITNRCTRVIEQLLTLSRLEPESTLPDMTEVDICESARMLMAELVPAAMDKDIDIELEAPDNPITLYASRGAIGILLRNLIDNAIRYTPEGGMVKVILHTDKKHVILQVIDSGPGVPENLRTRIFDRFFRQLGNKAEGSGLGLSIVSQIVRLHNAKIEALEPKAAKGLEMRVQFQLQ